MGISCHSPTTQHALNLKNGHGNQATQGVWDQR